jgi:hypothetical protein
MKWCSFNWELPNQFSLFNAARAAFWCCAQPPPAQALLQPKHARIRGYYWETAPIKEKYPNMLSISQALIDQMVAHSRQDHPDEACGVIAGPAGSDTPTRFIPMVNAARSPTFYEFDSADLLKALPGTRLQR